jgi:hypothetical protein
MRLTDVNLNDFALQNTVSHDGEIKLAEPVSSVNARPP